MKGVSGSYNKLRVTRWLDAKVFNTLSTQVSQL